MIDLEGTGEMVEGWGGEGGYMLVKCKTHLVKVRRPDKKISDHRRIYYHNPDCFSAPRQSDCGIVIVLTY